MRADLDAGIQERDRVRGAADTGGRLSVTVKTTGPLSAVRPAIIFFEKLLSFLAKSKTHLCFLFPQVALRILLVTKSTAFFDFSVGLRMFFSRRWMSAAADEMKEPVV